MTSSLRSLQYAAVEREERCIIPSDNEEGDGEHTRVVPMEIEGADYPMSTTRYQRSLCCKSLQRCCLLLLVIMVLLTLTAAYMGGLLPKYHLPNKSCPPKLHDEFKVSVLDLVLNKEARILSPAKLEALHGAHFGFTWDIGDNSTVQWRPQGITTLHLKNNASKFVLVSWYGRMDQWYFNPGARISFVQAQNHSVNNKIMVGYCHVLLVDQQFEPFPFLHAGGLAMDPATQTLHVPDSRYPWSYRVHVFDVLNSLYRVPPCHFRRFFGHDYLLRESHSYRAPTKPSFLSYDWDRQRMVMGTFAHDCGQGSTPAFHVDTPCHNPENKLAWIDLEEKQEVSHCAPVFRDMQGVASALVKETNDTRAKSILWVSSSYGTKHESHLHAVADFDPDTACNDQGQLKQDISQYQTMVLSYPPGLEDLHIELDEAAMDDKVQASSFGASDRTVWMLTEFGERIVFCAQMSKLLP